MIRTEHPTASPGVQPGASRSRGSMARAPRFVSLTALPVIQLTGWSNNNNVRAAGSALEDQRRLPGGGRPRRSRKDPATRSRHRTGW